jgi:hypothetical protein
MRVRRVPRRETVSKLPSEAATEIVENRQGVYGHPGAVYRVWAELLKPVLGYEPTREQCSMMLILLKCAREINAQYPKDYRDNVDDIAGFANVLHMVKEYPDGPRNPTK